MDIIFLILIFACPVFSQKTTLDTGPCDGDVMRDLVREMRELKREMIGLQDKLAGLNGEVGELKKEVVGEVSEILNICNQQGINEDPALISGLVYNIPDSALTASSSYDPRHGSQCCRIGVSRPATCSAVAWAMGSDDFSDAVNGWIQADLGLTFVVTAVATLGRGDWAQWITTYKMAGNSPTASPLEFNFYLENGTVKIFGGNSDIHTLVKHTLDRPMTGRYVRLYPIGYYKHPTLRWELYGKLYQD